MRWSGGSDFSVTPYAARYGLWSSVAREKLNGTYGKTPFGTAEAVDIRTALKSYTIWAAHQCSSTNRVGSNEVVKDADLAVWDSTGTPCRRRREGHGGRAHPLAGRNVYRGGAFPATR